MNSPHVEAVQHVVRTMAKVLEPAFSAGLEGGFQDSLVAVADGSGRIAAINALPHLGSAAFALAGIVAAFPAGLQAGDAVVCNDPYSGGTHLPDLTLCLAGDVGARRVLLLSRLHILDIGGEVPGGFHEDAREVWAEGVRVPPLMVWRRGTFDDPTAGTVLLNSRFPDGVRKSLDMMHDTCHAGLRELASASSPLDLDGLLGDGAIASAAFVQRATTEVGSGEASFEHPGGTSVVRVRASKSGDRLRLDLTESDAQGEGPFNAALGVTRTASAWPVASVMSQLDLGPVNGALLEHLEIVTKPSTVVDATFPSAVGYGPVGPGPATVRAVAAALTRMFAGINLGDADPGAVSGVVPRGGGTTIG